jgi:hypothetical protein
MVVIDAAALQPLADLKVAAAAAANCHFSRRPCVDILFVILHTKQTGCMRNLRAAVPPVRGHPQAEMDRMVRDGENMRPLPGLNKAHRPGPPGQSRALRVPHPPPLLCKPFLVRRVCVGAEGAWQPETAVHAMPDA